MTTPTPNERDREVARSIICDCGFASREYIAIDIIASYRQEIEAEKDKELSCAWETNHALQADYNKREKIWNESKQRISTLEAALVRAEKVIQMLQPQCALSAVQFQLCEEALAAIRKAMPTSPPSTSNPPSDPAAAP